MTEPRRISTKEFDALVSGQKTFFRTLEAQGKCIIGDPPAPAPVARFVPPLMRLIHRRVEIRISDGTLISGILEETSQYEVIIDGTIFLKHSVVSMRELPGVVTE
jgi:hypothetical protein